MKKLSILFTVAVLFTSGVLFSTIEQHQSDTDIIIVAGDEDYDPLLG